MVNNQKSYAAAVGQNSTQNPTQNISDISIYNRAVNKIRSKYGNSNSPTTGILA